MYRIYLLGFSCSDHVPHDRCKIDKNGSDMRHIASAHSLSREQRTKREKAVDNSVAESHERSPSVDSIGAPKSPDTAHFTYAICVERGQRYDFSIDAGTVKPQRIGREDTVIIIGKGTDNERKEVCKRNADRA